MRRLVAPAAIGILTLGACSGSDSSGGPPTSATTDESTVASSPAETSAAETSSSVPPPEGGTSPASREFDEAHRALTRAGRVDVNASGNRIVMGEGSLLDSEPVEVRLDGSPRWLVPAGASSWLAVLDDGSGVMIEVGDDREVSVERTDGDVDPERPPLASASGVAGFEDFHDLVADPLPDTRVVATDSVLVALAAPTDRYRHAVLGDDLEASAIHVVTPSVPSVRLVELDEPDVFEAVSPMLADVNDDGADDVVVTVSNGDVGARIVAYSLDDGSVIAETEPIGLGNRWRNLLAVGPIGPAGETEIVDVRTPHIGGTLEFFRVEGDRMQLVASAQTYSTHTIGSRNLDLGIVSDADGDGRLDVVVPIQDLSELAVVTRDDEADGGTREVGRIDLGGRLATNLSADTSATGVRYAIGLESGTVLIWP